ncbi:hypothetical protein PCANC_08686, partial [Puccinia coronata f. sp. avenae]
MQRDIPLILVNSMENLRFVATRPPRSQSKPWIFSLSETRLPMAAAPHRGDRRERWLEVLSTEPTEPQQDNH